MALAYWREDCRVNHPHIDREHQYLLKLLEDLYRFVLLDQNTDLIQTTLDTLFGAMMDHCETEEALMDVFGYPDQTGHTDQHEDILGRIFNYRLTLEQSLRPLTLDDVYDLATWLTSHVRTHDLKMVQYIQHCQRHNGMGIHTGANPHLLATLV